MLAAPYQLFPGPDAPFAMAVEDLNHDGRPDLLVAGHGLSVLPGLGNGALGAGVRYDADDAVSMAIGDLDRDGILDAAVASMSGLGAVVVLRGNGDGSFDSWGRLPIATPCAVALGDLNGDGRLDLVAVHGGYYVFTGNFHGNGDSIAVLLGNGDGTFTPAREYTTAAGPCAVAIGDLDGDGVLDLAVSAAGVPPDAQPAMSILLGNGDGTFVARRDMKVHRLATRLVIDDFDRDGNADLLGGSGQGVSVWLGRGDGAFGTARDCDFGTGPLNQNSLAIGDIDDDGIVDLVTTEGHHAAVFIGKGAGHFEREIDGVIPDAGPVVLGDFDQDGRRDMAVAFRGHSGYAEEQCRESGLAVLLGHGDGSFGVDRRSDTAVDPRSVAMADLNRDGELDVAVAAGSSGKVSVLLGSGGGEFGARRDCVTNVFAASVVIADLDLDGAADLAVADRGTDAGPGSTVSVFLGAGDGSFGGRNTFPTGSGPAAIAAGDLNGDGKPDLVTADAVSMSVSVLLGNGDGSLAEARSNVVASGNPPSSVAIADVDLDGRLDVIAGCNGWEFDGFGEPGRVVVLLGMGDGTFQSARSFYCTLIDVGSIAVGDLNGDAKPDLAVMGCLFAGNGDGTFERLACVPAGATPSAIQIADLDGDGRLDLVTGSNGSPTNPPWQCTLANGGVSVMRGTGGATFGPWTEFGTGSAVPSLAVGDVDHDGRPDVVAVNRDAHSVSVLINQIADRPPVDVPLVPTVSEFALGPAVPNPAAGRVRFEFAVARASRVRLSVLDVQGREVAVLSDGVQAPGRYQATWEGTTASGRAPAGLYFVRYQANGQHWTRRFVLAR